MKVLTRTTDEKGRVVLPDGFESCTVELIVEGEEVRIRKVRPARKRKYRLRDPLAGITPDNLHPEWGTGPPVGKELL
jgi:antitoxin component of MazEF toxin-antitoxin module